MPHTYRTVARNKLRRGMIVKTPTHYFDLSEDGDPKRPLSDIWPDAPAELRVDLWDLEDGESKLSSLTSSEHLDLNTAAYPKTFQVRVDKPGNGGTKKTAKKKSSIGAHLARATRDPFA